jgi:hypothetical protein
VCLEGGQGTWTLPRMGSNWGVRFGKVGMHEKNGLWGNMGELGVLICEPEEMMGGAYQGGSD